MHSSITKQNITTAGKKNLNALLGYSETLHRDITYRGTDLTNPSVWVFECGLEPSPGGIAVRWEGKKTSSLPKEKERERARDSLCCVL